MPAVQRAAKERLACLVDPAISTLVRHMRSRNPKAAMVSFLAAKDLLDRADVKSTTKVEITNRATAESAIVMTDDDLRAKLLEMGQAARALMRQLGSGGESGAIEAHNVAPEADNHAKA